MYKEMAEQLFEKFVLNKSVVAIQKSDGRYVATKAPFSIFLIEQMIKEGYSLGTYQQQTYSDTLKWICFDFDCKNSYDIEDLFELKSKYVEKFLIKLNDLKIHYLIEFSGRRGFHIWVLFDSTITKDLGYKIVDKLSNQIYVEILKDAKYALDLFPKTSSGKKKNKYGLQVKLPLSKHKKGHYSYFIDSLSDFRGEIVTRLNSTFIEEQLKILKKYTYNRVENILEILNIKQYSEDSLIWHYKKEFIITEHRITIQDIENVFVKDKALKIIWDNITSGSMTHQDRTVVLGMFIHITGGETVLNEIFSKQKNYNPNLTNQLIMENKNFYFPLSIKFLHQSYHIDVDDNYLVNKNKYLGEFFLDELGIDYRNQVISKNRGKGFVEGVIQKETNYIGYNDEVPNVDILSEINNISYYDIKEIEKYIEQVISGEKKTPTKIRYKKYIRQEKEKERILISLHANERIITTALAYKLISYLQKDYNSYSYHLNFSNNGDVFYPWISSWKRFKEDVSQFFITDLFCQYYFIKIDFKNFYGNIFLQSVYSILLETLRADNGDAENFKNIYNYLTTFNEKLMLEVNDTIRGVPQGPAYARVLAEITLDIILDEFWNKCDYPASQFKFYRYVDDVYVFHDEDIDSYEFLKRFSEHIEKYGLYINRLKTKCYGKIKDMPYEEKIELQEFNMFNYDLYNIKDVEIISEQEHLQFEEKYSKYLYRKVSWDINDANFILSSNISNEIKDKYLTRYFDDIVASKIGRGSVFNKFYSLVFENDEYRNKFFYEKRYINVPINSINFKNMIANIYFCNDNLLLLDKRTPFLEEFIIFYLNTEKVEKDEKLLLLAIVKYLRDEGENDRCY